MRKTVILLSVFCILLSKGYTKTLEVAFLNAYIKKDEKFLVKAMTPPEPLLSEIERLQAERGKVSITKIKADRVKFMDITKELFRDCVFPFIPIQNFMLLENLPQINLQKLFFVNILEKEERQMFQDKIVCNQKIYKTTSNNRIHYSLVEKCTLKQNNKSWIDKFAIYGRSGSFLMLKCVIDKMKKLAE